MAIGEDPAGNDAAAKAEAPAVVSEMTPKSVAVEAAGQAVKVQEEAKLEKEAAARSLTRSTGEP